MQVADKTVAKVVSLKQQQHYQLACCAVYESLHGKRIEVTAPHQYFAESRQHYKDEQDAETTKKERDAQM
jgi:hypothetical protein